VKSALAREVFSLLHRATSLASAREMASSISPDSFPNFCFSEMALQIFIVPRLNLF
jgi:hypothetical protein